MRELIVISLGGSLVVPDRIDVNFLKKFKKVLEKYTKTKRFFIFVGGGRTAREYQKAMKEFKASNTELDLIGISISRNNAKIVSQVFLNKAYPEIVIDPTKKVSTNKNIILGAGYKPGFSTDYVSVLSAKTNNIKTVVNLTNMDYVYDKNPRKFKNAKPVKEISWKDFRKIVGNKWTPGLSMPFDPRASKLAQQSGIKVAIINGKKLNQFENFIKNKPFIGSIIR